MTDSRIHPTAYIGEGVRLGDDVAVGPHAVLLGPLTVGDRVWIGAGAQLGAPPEIATLRQNTAWTGDLEHSGVVIESDAVIRENVVIHQGSHRATRIGARSWVLTTAYIAHDVLVGRDSTVSAGVTVGGHAVLGDRVTIGMNATVHQGRVIGPGAMVGMGTPVSRDVPPFSKVFGTPPRVRGVNTVGLFRAGYEDSVGQSLSRAFAQGDSLLASAIGLEAIADEVAWWRDARPSAFMAVSLTSGGTR